MSGALDNNISEQLSRCLINLLQCFYIVSPSDLAVFRWSNVAVKPRLCQVENVMQCVMSLRHCLELLVPTYRITLHCISIVVQTLALDEMILDVHTEIVSHIAHACHDLAYNAILCWPGSALWKRDKYQMQPACSACHLEQVLPVYGLTQCTDKWPNALLL